MRRIVAIFALAGCAVGPSFSERMALLIGASEAQLVEALGVPTRSHETDGRRFLQFEERRTVLVPGSDPFSFYGPYGRWRGGWGGPNTALAFCDVTWALRQGRAESFAARGNCR